MSNSAAITSAQPLPIVPMDINKMAPWAVFGLLLAIVVLYFVGAEQGATQIFAGDAVHEWVHDGRHLLGFPCH